MIVAPKAKKTTDAEGADRADGGKRLGFNIAEVNEWVGFVPDQAVDDHLAGLNAVTAHDHEDAECQDEGTQDESNLAGGDHDNDDQDREDGGGDFEDVAPGGAEVLRSHWDIVPRCEGDVPITTGTNGEFNNSRCRGDLGL